MRRSNVIALFLYFAVGCSFLDAYRKLYSKHHRCLRCKDKADRRPRYAEAEPGSLKSDFKLSVRTDSFLHNIDERYLSVTIDTIEMKRHWSCLPLQSTKLLRLANALSPAYLRVGGTDQDFLTFIPDEQQQQQQKQQQQQHFNKLSSNYQMSKESLTNPRIRQGNEFLESGIVDCTPNFSSFNYKSEFNVTLGMFDEIAEFAERAGWKFIFGLNARKRNPDGSWDSRNAKLIVEHALRKNYDVSWELGNEPNRYGKYAAAPILVSPEQLAEDFHKLRMLTMGRASIFGPDANKPKHGPPEFLLRFLQGEPHVRALTYHQYYIHESDARLQDYLNPFLLDQLAKQMQSVLSVSMNVSQPLPIWLGETGSSSGGGAKDLSDTYAAGFLYLDKLGLAARYGHQVVLRQSFYGGYYGLLDPITLDPLPDYWSALIFKNVVGSKVLHIDDHGKFFRVYAFCSKAKGDVVILALNMNHVNISFRFDGKLDQKSITQYLLSPADGHIQSKEVLLNGESLRLTNDTKLASISGKIVKQPIGMPPLTYGFYVVNNAEASICVD